MTNIYSHSVDGSAFQSFCGGNLSGEHEACVEIAPVPGAGPAFVLRDNKPEGAGKELRFTEAELDDFALGWAAQRGLKL